MLTIDLAERRWRPFHADLSLAAGTAAGTYTLLASVGRALLLTRLTVSTDTAQRVVIGAADAQGQRLWAGYITAGDSRDATLSLQTAELGLTGADLVAITAAASGLDVQLDGYILER